jgi:hypothetical protein
MQNTRPPQEKASASAPRRPWKGVIFSCCNVYGRVYKSAHSGLYEGNCPRCARKARLRF